MQEKLNIKIIIILIGIILASYIVFESSNYADQSVNGNENIIINNNTAIPSTKNSLPIESVVDDANLIGTHGANIMFDDDDDDGIINIIDSFPLNPEEWDDFDFDGIGANEDQDDDNDGILDINDNSPSHPSAKLSLKYLDLVENCTIMDSGYYRDICYKDGFVSLVVQGENGIDIMNLATFFENNDLISDCHHVAHHVGYATFLKNQDFSASMINVENICREGYFHGVVSAYFVNSKNEGKDFSNLHKTLCDEFVDDESLYNRCIHGVGHGLMLNYEDDYRQAINACHELSDDLSDITCTQGLFMEYTERELSKEIQYEKGIPEICSELELISNDNILCYKALGQMITFKTNHDIEKSLRLCHLISVQEDIDDCYVGVLAEVFYSRELREECELPEEQKVNLDCYNRAMFDLLLKINDLK